MLGGIYTQEKCSLCDMNFKDNGFDALACPNHPDHQAKRLRVYFQSVNKRFNNYERAAKFLYGLRLKVDEGIFDPRDYQKENPLGFANLIAKYLESKRKMKAVRKYQERLQKAVDAWGNENVKEIGYAEIEDLLLSLNYSSKYIHDIKCCLEGFFRWLYRREEITKMPRFPEVSYTMSYRNIVNKETQWKILDEIHRLTFGFNPRIWIGVLFLSTYINLRPAELINIKEGHIELENKRILIPDPKEGNPKYVYLIEEDVELLRSMPRAFPEMYFYRHLKGNGAAKPGQRFGKDYLYKWWKRACANLDIVGVDLYGGTKHSSAVDLRKRHSPETVRRLTGHRTNKAFERYLQVTGDELRPVYADTRGGKRVAKKECRP